MSGTEQLLTFADVEKVTAGKPLTITVEELRACRIHDGQHLWVVGLVYLITNPEAALGDMPLGLHNLIGAQPITCLWCVRRYVSPTMPGPRCEAREG